MTTAYWSQWNDALQCHEIMNRNDKNSVVARVRYYQVAEGICDSLNAIREDVQSSYADRDPSCLDDPYRCSCDRCQESLADIRIEDRFESGRGN